MKSTAPRPNGMSVSKSSSSSHSHCAPSSSSSPSCRPASVRPSSSSSSPCATSPASSSSSSRSASPSSCSPSSCAKSASLSRCFLSSHASVSCPSLLLSPSRRPPSSSRSLALIEEVDQDDSVTLCTTSRHSERKNKKQNLETGREKEEAALKTQDAEAVPSDAGGEAEGEKKNKKKGARKKKKSVAAVGGVVREKDASLFEDLDDLLNKCRSFIPELRKSNELLLEKEGQEIQIETTDNSMKKKKKESEAEQQQEEEAKKNKKKTKTELLEAEEREEDKPYIELGSCFSRNSFSFLSLSFASFSSSPFIASSFVSMSGSEEVCLCLSPGLDTFPLATSVFERSFFSQRSTFSQPSLSSLLFPSPAVFPLRSPNSSTTHRTLPRLLPICLRRFSTASTLWSGRARRMPPLSLLLQEPSHRLGRLHSCTLGPSTRRLDLHRPRFVTPCIRVYLCICVPTA